MARSTRTLLAAVTAASILVTAGCSASPSGETSATPISLMIWDPAQEEGVQKAVDAFEAVNEDIAVNLELVPEDQYYTKLDASLGAGEGPDVMWQSSRASYYADGGVLEPLDTYLERDKIDLTDYSTQIVDLYSFDGRQFGIPKDRDVWTIIYNTTVFEELGISNLPTDDWTWEDMVGIAEEVRASQSGNSITPLHYNYVFNWGVANVIRQLGGELVTDDGRSGVASAAGAEALRRIKGLQDDNLIIPIRDATDFDPVGSLISGRLAMAQIPSWHLSTLADSDVPEGTLAAVPLPSLNGSRLSDTNGLSYMMNAQSKEKDAAWELIKFLTSTEGAVLHAEGGAALPANTDPAVLEAFAETNSSIDNLANALTAAQEESYLRITTEYPETRPTMPDIDSNVLAPFYAGSIDADEAAEQISAILDKVLQ